MNSNLVLTFGLGESLAQLVEQACAMAHARTQAWTPGAEVSGASLLVAALETGQREVPLEVASAMRGALAATPLLMLAREPLVRPSVSLQGGRITLLGHPLSAEAISSRMRIVMSGDNAAQEAAERAPGPLVREYRGREWWVATASVCVQGDDAAVFAPSFRRLDRYGFLAAVPTAAESSVSLPSLAPKGDSSSREEDERALLAAVGKNVACLRLAPQGPKWSFLIPENAVAWITSPGRLPSQHSLSRVERGWWSLQGAAGDLVIVASGSASTLVESGASEGWLWQSTVIGGASLLDQLLRRFDTPGARGCFAIAEMS